MSLILLGPAAVGGMLFLWEKVDVQANKLNQKNTFQASTHVTSANVPVTKASQVAHPEAEPVAKAGISGAGKYVLRLVEKHQSYKANGTQGGGRIEIKSHHHKQGVQREEIIIPGIYFVPGTLLCFRLKSLFNLHKDGKLTCRWESS